jgi:hypothetical protein
VLRHVTDPLRTTAGHGTPIGTVEASTKTCGAPLGEGRRVVTLAERATTNGTSLPCARAHRSSDPHGAPMTGHATPQVATR